MTKLGLRCLLALVAAGVLGCNGDSGGGEAPRTLQVLVFTRTEGFRHPSIEDAVRVLGSLAPEEMIVATFTEDAAMFIDATLAEFDVIAFVNTTGDVLDPDEQAAVERFVRGGKGYVGVHSAADTEYQWPWYGQLVGAYFTSHPVLPLPVTVTTEDNHHPSTAHLAPTFVFEDEWYNFDRNPRTDNVILLTIDEAGFTLPNIPIGSPSMGADHPVAWYKEFDGGRSFYTNLGHRPETWGDPLFMQHLLEGIRWAAASVEFNRIALTSEAKNPMALAVAPDGRVFYVERTGEVRVWQPDSGRAVEALRLEVDTEYENGLLGIALDPGFDRNRFIYLYHSTPVRDPPASGPPGTNMLSRFTVGSDSRIDPATRVDLFGVPSERECCHEGGSLAFAPDGTLFLSTGDNTDPFEAMGFAPLDERPGRDRFNSQRTAANPSDLRGKILRINPDGTAAEGNLFPVSGEQGRPEIYVMGVRNPFRIAVDADRFRVFWGDVGPDAFNDSERGPRGYDEINVADGPGNHGWPYCIGPNRPYADYDFATATAGPPFSCDGLRPPVLAYDYITVSYLALGNALNPEGNPALPGIPFTGRTAIAGTFYQRASTGAPFALPERFADTLLMTEWTRDVIASVSVGENGALQNLTRIVPFFRLRRPIDLEIGPDGALYVLEYGTGYSGDNLDAQLTRIEYSAARALTPVAELRASVVAGAAPLTVALSAEGSRAPGRDDDIASYEWDVDGDGNTDSTAPQLEHTFTTNGLYPVTLTVVGRSGRRSFPVVTEVVVGNTPPQVTITAPADGAHVADGSLVTLSGSGEDAEDGPAACAKLTWDIRLGHNAHSHPLFVLYGCEVSFRATPGHGPQLSYVIELSYTDLGGPTGEPSLTSRAGITLVVE